MGRPTKLTPEVQEKIVSLVRAGNYPEVAAQAAGIDPRTYYRWMEKGEDGPAPYGQFRHAVKEAQAAAESHAVTIIRKAAIDGSWQAAAWFLERSHPRKWGRHDRHEVTGPDGGPVEFAVDASTLEARLASIIAKRRGADESGDNPSGSVVVE